MHRLQLDSAREEPKELGTPISSFRKIGHQWCCARRSYSVRTTVLAVDSFEPANGEMTSSDLLKMLDKGVVDGSAT